ncbi:aminoglycoside phosphotransferase family protein [Nocardia sp. NPDC055029]|uniref:aminoglycoside phosphotransferase family protein n=1 Tax=Nocardia sp. NPDC060259 TaxID=3347088 RepID=UPI0036511CC6
MTTFERTPAIDLDVATVAGLVAEQFPRWKDLPLNAVESAGTDNAIYRLGADKAVRLPRLPSAVGQVDKEQKWLPRLAPRLPLAVPVPLGRGEPGTDYPWEWSIYRWLDGQSLGSGRLGDPRGVATDLGAFITALRSIDSAGGPEPGAHNFFRGVALAARDRSTREAIAAVTDELDAHAVTAAWQSALDAAPWSSPGVWIHGDLSSGNLLFDGDRLTGVIDFGGLAVGDPACDLSVAWELFDADTRWIFRSAARIDDASWDRGRGWALSIALIQLPYYRSSNPVVAARARHVIGVVLADHDNP